MEIPNANTLSIQLLKSEKLFTINFDLAKMMELYRGIFPAEMRANNFDLALFEQFEESLKKDVIMLILSESLEKIRKYFEDNKRDRKKYNLLYTSLYLDDHRKLERVLNKVSFGDMKDQTLKKYVMMYFDQVSTAFIPWDLYCASKILNSRTKKDNGINKIFDAKYLPLFNLRGNNRHNQLNDALEDIHFFCELFKIEDALVTDFGRYYFIKNHKVYWNTSINFMKFNQITNLIDVLLISERIFDQKGGTRGSLEKLKDECIADISNIMPLVLLPGIALKRLIYENYSGHQLIYIKPVIQYIEEAKKNLIDEIRGKIKFKDDLEQEFIKNVPQDLLGHIKICEILMNDELYKDSVSEFSIQKWKDENNLSIFKSSYSQVYDYKNKNKKKSEHPEQGEQNIHLINYRKIQQARKEGKIDLTPIELH